MMGLGKFRQFFIKMGYVPETHSLIGHLKLSTVSHRSSVIKLDFIVYIVS